jgi:hypothetical protein
MSKVITAPSTDALLESENRAEQLQAHLRFTVATTVSKVAALGLPSDVIVQELLTCFTQALCENKEKSIEGTLVVPSTHPSLIPFGGVMCEMDFSVAVTKDNVPAALAALDASAPVADASPSNN